MAISPKRKSQGPSPIGEMLRDFFSEKMPQNLGVELSVFGAWPKAVGPEISRQAQPKFFRNGILFVETRHRSWTTELVSKRHLIQRKLNEALGQEIVRDIRFQQARS
jgi:predicted nucleic acid-binding Zn ribbon protein